MENSCVVPVLQVASIKKAIPERMAFSKGLWICSDYFAESGVVVPVVAGVSGTEVGKLGTWLGSATF